MLDGTSSGRDHDRPATRKDRHRRADVRPLAPGNLRLLPAHARDDTRPIPATGVCGRRSRPCAHLAQGGVHWRVLRARCAIFPEHMVGAASPALGIDLLARRCGATITAGATSRTRVRDSRIDRRRHRQLALRLRCSLRGRSPADETRHRRSHDLPCHLSRPVPEQSAGAVATVV